MIVELISVASVIDSKTLIVYATYSTGTNLYDPDSAIDLARCPNTWYDNLDEWDRAALSEIMYQKTLTRY